MHARFQLTLHVRQSFISQEESVGTLFRGNTLATKAVDQYMKMVAIDYLRSTIGETITNICEDKRSCEMDPSRGAKPAETAKVCACCADCLYSADNAWQVLSSHCTALCRKIFASAGQCPRCGAWPRPLLTFIA